MKPAEPLIHIEDVLTILNKIAILGGLSSSQLHEVLILLKKVTYEKGEIIFKQGDTPSHIYIIFSGKIKIVADMDTTPLEIIEFGVGQCFGETAVIGIQPHTASAIATEKTELLILSKQSLLSIHHNDLELFSYLILNIAREACRRLHKSDEIFLHYVEDQKNHHNSII